MKHDLFNRVLEEQLDLKVKEESLENLEKWEAQVNLDYRDLLDLLVREEKEVSLAYLDQLDLQV